MTTPTTTTPPLLAALIARVEGLTGGGIYVASKTVHARRWRLLRDTLGYPICSTWIDEAGEGETGDFSDLWRRCIAEASSAAVLIAYHEQHEVLKGAFIEIGAALASGRPVFMVGSHFPGTWMAHPLVSKFDSTDAAFKAALRALQAQQEGR